LLLFVLFLRVVDLVIWYARTSLAANYQGIAFSAKPTDLLYTGVGKRGLGRVLVVTVGKRGESFLIGYEGGNAHEFRDFGVFFTRGILILDQREKPASPTYALAKQDLATLRRVQLHNVEVLSLSSFPTVLMLPSALVPRSPGRPTSSTTVSVRPCPSAASAHDASPAPPRTS
jgi:hypothetical protein